MRLPGPATVSKRYPILALAFKGDHITALSCIKCIAVTLLIPTLVCLGVWIDGTWRMSGNARGLSQHYGFWAQCVTTPAILLLAATILASFVNTIKSLERYSASGVVPQDLKRLISKHIISLCLRGRSRFLLYLGALVGGMWTIVNVIETSDPVKVYGNLVFDSPDHRYGFLATKLFLLFNWALAYPIVIFIVLHVTLSMVFILHHMCSHRLLRIDFFHPDNCGGMSAFGTINLLIMGVYLNFFLVIISLMLTHSAHYFTLVLSAALACLIFFLQSIGAVYYIHRFIKIKKRESLKRINDHLDRQMLAAISAGQFSGDLLLARSHLLSVKTYPYTRQAAAIINFIRFSPALLGIIKLLPHVP